MKKLLLLGIMVYWLVLTGQDYQKYVLGPYASISDCSYVGGQYAAAGLAKYFTCIQG